MLKGKIAVVTGGTRGIGYAIVRKFLQNNAQVVLFGLKKETVKKALEKLTKENPSWKVEGSWPDLTDTVDVEREIKRIQENYGKIDILVNNAGVSDDKGIDEYNVERSIFWLIMREYQMIKGLMSIMSNSSQRSCRSMWML